MAGNWGIVIGIDHYDAPNASLRGAVNDALQMREWLLNADGGNVPLRQLTCLLSPEPGRTLNVPGAIEATRANVITSIDRLLSRSGGEGDRFFFYFAGHGLSARIIAANQSGMAFSDFTKLLTDNSLTVDALFALFQSTQFKEQFFFIDGCRNAPFGSNRMLGSYPDLREPRPPVSPQFGMYATAPMQEAIEVDERGAFTRALLEGLSGQGRAKRWDANEGAEGAYVVRWNSLLTYVSNAVKSRKLETVGGDFIQTPRRFGEDGGEDPILGKKLKPAEAPDERLTVRLAPDDAFRATSVIVRDLSGVVKTEPRPIQASPMYFDLPPRSYGVDVDAAGWARIGNVKSVDLYEPSEIALNLTPAPWESSEPTSVDFVMIKSYEIGIDGGRAADDATYADLSVTSDDPLAMLEIADESGKILKTGRERICRNVAPGFYRARLVSPEGEVAEELRYVEEGTTLTVNVRAPSTKSPVLKRLIRSAHFSRSPDRTVSPSEAVGPSAWLRLSTVLALAAAASLEPNANDGENLRSIGIPRFRTDKIPGSGVQIAIGSEVDDIWTQRQLVAIGDGFPAQLPQLPAEPSVASGVFERDAGAYTVRLHDPVHGGQSVLALPVVVLPGRLTLVVVTLDTDDDVHINLYMPAIDPRAGIDRDPDFSDSNFAAIRRIELMQRAAAKGRVSPTIPDIDLLLYDKWRDPVAGCLGVYLGLRSGTRDEFLDQASANLVRFFGLLPDAHVLRGAVLDKLGRGAEADVEYGIALDRGIPMFRDGVTILARAAQQKRFGHPNVDQLASIAGRPAADPLWSATIV